MTKYWEIHLLIWSHWVEAKLDALRNAFTETDYKECLSSPDIGQEELVGYL